MNQALAARGVAMAPADTQALLDELREAGKISRFAELVSTFLKLHKASDLTFEQLGWPARAEVLIGWRARLRADTWFGEQLQRGTGLAVADLNAAGGVLGQQVRLITGMTTAIPSSGGRRKKLVSDGVIFVVGTTAPMPRSRHRESTRRRKS